jgi:hypothetical protein
LAISSLVGGFAQRESEKKMGSLVETPGGFLVKTKQRLILRRQRITKDTLKSVLQGLGVPPTDSLMGEVEASGESIHVFVDES